MKKISILASGAGSNALNLIEASRKRSDILVTSVIVDNPSSPLPELIREKFPFVPVHRVTPDSNLLWKEQKRKLEEEILSILSETETEWIFLAGYMRIVGPTLLEAFPLRIINIHPSLLPSFPGLEAYHKAWQAGVSESGVTIHLVDDGMDTGPILLQKSFPRLPEDTYESFVQRGKEIEWELYPQVFNKLDKPFNRYMFVIQGESQESAQVYWLESSKDLHPQELETIKLKIGDSVDQKVTVNELTVKAPMKLTSMKPGVTDNPAKSFRELVETLPCLRNVSIRAWSGILSREYDYNPLIHSQLEISTATDIQSIIHMDFSFTIPAPEVKVISLVSKTDSELIALSQKNCWALSLEEMLSIRNYFSSLGRNPTDVEIEMIAQTWSEHCKHKIFNAEIEYEDDKQKLTINSLFKEFIKAPTYALNKPWAISLFDDNAGVVRFREGMDLCIKVETHNSPSALDPYGGALTGILGVNRDILGTGLGAKPVANTDVFCVGMPDEKDLPKALLHPSKILEGIHRGVQDGGNKSGIPTVNGAIYFDESYSGKPLVYCGTVGIIPPTIKGQKATAKGQRPGDLIVMAGGDVGIDGIHGATASSLVMDQSTTIGMVQIGDPFSQKRMTDFVLAARDELLFNSITDNGAGGLSSSVGEMAFATNGASLNLEKVPLKYPGLSPWQILVSESQERMTLSVPKENWEAFRQLADKFQVKVTAIGEFTDNGKFSCSYQNEKVCELDLTFIDKGLPKLRLKARHQGSYQSWKNPSNKNLSLSDHHSIMTHLMSHPSLASKERWIRQYDHEVQGGTVVKPMEGLTFTAPNDAGVLWYGAYGLDGYDGFAVASGLAPHFSIDDAELMAKMAVDEAVRNLVCQGADPEKIALVDNFCWPDPVKSGRTPDGEFKLAQLVRTCMGLKSMMETYRMPLVSGKDSMKNDYVGEDVKISVLPTLLVTGLGHVPDVRHVPKAHAEAGALIYRLGEKHYETYFGHFLHQLSSLKRQNSDTFNWASLRARYGKIHQAIYGQLISSIHDITDGGFLPALVESLMLNQLGLKLELASGIDRTSFLYSELPGHFVVSVKPQDQEAFEALFSSDERELLGKTDTGGKICFDEVVLDTTELAQKWRNA